MKLYLFLRSIIWTSVISVLAATAALVLTFIAPPFSIPLALISISFSILTSASRKS